MGTIPGRQKADFNDEHCRQLLQQSGVALIVSHGLEEEVGIVNDTFTRLFGYTIEDIPDVSHWWPIAYPDEAYREAVKTEWQTRVGKAIANQSAIESMEAKVRCKDGSKRHIEFHFSSVGDINLVNFVDLTERKTAEERLRESEERLRLAQRAAGIGSFEWDIRTGAESWTPELEAMYGLPPGGFDGTHSGWINLIHADDLAEVQRLADVTLKTGRPMTGEWRVVWPDRSVHWIAGRWQVSMDQYGKPWRVLGVNIDVTERRRAQDALAELHRTLEAQTALLQSREELLKIFVKNVPVAVAMLDREMRYLQVSDRWCSDNSVEASEILGRSRYEAPEMPEHLKEANRRALQGETLRADEDCWESGGHSLGSVGT